MATVGRVPRYNRRNPFPSSDKPANAPCISSEMAISPPAGNVRSRPLVNAEFSARRTYGRWSRPRPKTGARGSSRNDLAIRCGGRASVHQFARIFACITNVKENVGIVPRRNAFSRAGKTLLPRTNRIRRHRTSPTEAMATLATGRDPIPSTMRRPCHCVALFSIKVVRESRRSPASSARRRSAKARVLLPFFDNPDWRFYVDIAMI